MSPVTSKILLSLSFYRRFIADFRPICRRLVPCLDQKGTASDKEEQRSYGYFLVGTVCLLNLPVLGKLPQRGHFDSIRYLVLKASFPRG